MQPHPSTAFRTSPYPFWGGRTDARATGFIVQKPGTLQLAPDSMTIIAHINHGLGIRLHRIVGRVTADDFLEAVSFYRAHPEAARTDMISLVDDGVDVSGSRPADLETLRSAYRELYAELRLEVVLRSAWVCANVRAWPLLEEWLRDRHSRDGMATEVCLVTRLDEADCMYDEIELAAVRSGAGFEPLQTFGQRSG